MTASFDITGDKEITSLCVEHKRASMMGRRPNRDLASLTNKATAANVGVAMERRDQGLTGDETNAMV